MYDRDNPRYPYKSHGQWLKACYGLVACLLLVIFNGVGTFLEKPFDTRMFIASYISVSFRSLSYGRTSANHLRSLFLYFYWLATNLRSTGLDYLNGAPNDLMIYETVSKRRQKFEKEDSSFQMRALQKRMGAHFLIGFGYG
jgi:hypothetical protein